MGELDVFHRSYSIIGLLVAGSNELTSRQTRVGVLFLVSENVRNRSSFVF